MKSADHIVKDILIAFGIEPTHENISIGLSHYYYYLSEDQKTELKQETKEN